MAGVSSEFGYFDRFGNWVAPKAHPGLPGTVPASAYPVPPPAPAAPVNIPGVYQRPPGLSPVAPAQPLYGQIPPASSADSGLIKPFFQVLPLVSVVPNSDASGSGTSGGAFFTVIVPSAKLACTFSIAFEPTDANPINESPYGTPIWTATVVRPSRDGGKRAPLHALFSSQTLPQGYSVSGAEMEIDVTSTLYVVDNSSISGSLGLPGTWVAHVVWEPAVPMCPEEAQALYSRCLARVTRKPAQPFQVPGA